MPERRGERGDLASSGLDLAVAASNPRFVRLAATWRVRGLGKEETSVLGRETEKAEKKYFFIFVDRT